MRHSATLGAWQITNQNLAHAGEQPTKIKNSSVATSTQPTGVAWYWFVVAAKLWAGK